MQIRLMCERHCRLGIDNGTKLLSKSSAHQKKVGVVYCSGVLNNGWCVIVLSVARVKQVMFLEV
jgi:hypothetical protein